MKILIFFFLLVSSAYAQEVTGEVSYHYRNEPFPYDSGVAISDRQYRFILQMQAFAEIKNKATVQPKIVIHTVTQSKKGDGKKWVWFTTGAGAGILTWVASSVIKKSK